MDCGKASGMDLRREPCGEHGLLGIHVALVTYIFLASPLQVIYTGIRKLNSRTVIASSSFSNQVLIYMPSYSFEESTVC